jgi:hypothetical protein
MLHHIRLKHHINDATKADYLSMDFDSALNSFSDYEKTFGKVLKSTMNNELKHSILSFVCIIDRLLLPKIDYIDCTWDELKSKLSLHDDLKRQCRSSSSIEQQTIINNSFSSMNDDEQNIV